MGKTQFKLLEKIYACQIRVSAFAKNVTLPEMKVIKIFVSENQLKLWKRLSEVLPLQYN